VTEYLTAKQVAELTNISVQSLANWRAARRGPPFTRIERAVRYPADALQRWLDARTSATHGEGQP
jgi:predicted DNA-binding transcriptional regulator AlpA